MKWHHHRIWIVAVLIISGVVLAWFIARTPDVPPSTTGSTSTTTTDLAGRAIYTNGEYGFALMYPETARVEEIFSPQYRAGSAWRVNALADATGTPVLAIIAYSTESDNSYPRHFVAQVRVGASSDPDEVAGCLAPTPNRGETALADKTINGTTWKTFSFGDAGMMQYVSGVSYRVLHEGSCIALEKIRSGSSYQDDPESPEDITDAELDSRYAGLDHIIESFTFARP